MKFAQGLMHMYDAADVGALPHIRPGAVMRDRAVLVQLKINATFVRNL